MNTISPLSGVLSVGSATSEGAKGRNDTLRQGQSFKAMVVEAKGANLFVLEAGGSRITAQARLPLSVGQTLQLQVTATAPQVELRILSDSANLFSGKSIILLGQNINLKALLAPMSTLPTEKLDSLASASRRTFDSYSRFSADVLSEKDGGGLLKQLVDRLGLSFEALLARGDKAGAQNSLKAALLELAQVFRGAEQLTESANKLLSTIELYQLAQLQLEREDVYLFPLPIPFLEKGYLVVEDFGKDNDDSSAAASRFSLHLALEGLGNLRVDLLQNEHGLYLKFASDSQEKLHFLEAFKEDLLPHLIGKTILGVSFALEHVDPSADLLRRLLPNGESIVNTTA